MQGCPEVTQTYVQYATYSEAVNAIPEDAKWSCSFGNPGDGGFSAIFRDKAEKITVCNYNPVSREGWMYPHCWYVTRSPLEG